MPKQLISLRINALTKSQLDELCRSLNETQAGVFALALDRMYREQVRIKPDDISLHYGPPRKNKNR